MLLYLSFCKTPCSACMWKVRSYSITSLEMISLLAIAPPPSLSHNRLQMIRLCGVTLWPGALQAVCQLLLSPVGPIRAPEWERLQITHLYPLKASDAAEEGDKNKRGCEGGSHRASMYRWVLALVCDTDESCCHFHVQTSVTFPRCSHAFCSRRWCATWWLRCQRTKGYLPLCTKLSLIHSFFFSCFFKWMPMWLCLPGPLSWAMQNLCLGVIVMQGKSYFHHTLWA